MDWQHLNNYRGHAIAMRWSREAGGAWRIEWAVGTFVEEKFTSTLPPTVVTFTGGLLNGFMACAQDAEATINQLPEKEEA